MPVSGSLGPEAASVKGEFVGTLPAEFVAEVMERTRLLIDPTIS
jgi:hypothetical protein